MIDKRIRQLQAAGKQVEIAALGARIRVDRQPRSGVKLDPLGLGLRRGDQRIEVERPLQFVQHEFFGVRAAGSNPVSAGGGRSSGSA